MIHSYIHKYVTHLYLLPSTFWGCQ